MWPSSGPHVNKPSNGIHSNWCPVSKPQYLPDRSPSEPGESRNQESSLLWRDSHWYSPSFSKPHNVFLFSKCGERNGCTSVKVLCVKTNTRNSAWISLQTVQNDLQRLYSCQNGLCVEWWGSCANPIGHTHLTCVLRLIGNVYRARNAEFAEFFVAYKGLRCVQMIA